MGAEYSARQARKVIEGDALLSFWHGVVHPVLARAASEMGLNEEQADWCAWFSGALALYRDYLKDGGIRGEDALVIQTGCPIPQRGDWKNARVIGHCCGRSTHRTAITYYLPPRIDEQAGRATA